MAVKIEIFNPQATVNRICKSDKVGLFLANTCERYMNDFVPMDSGALAQNVTIEPFKVIYNSVYARKQFYGTGFNFSHEKHALATARWDMACSSAKGQQIAKELTEYLKRM